MPEASSADEFEKHLATCPACREFQQTLLALDEQLTRTASRVVVPADFTATVLARLPLTKPRLSPAEIAERKARYEREYQAMMATLDWTRPFRRAAIWLRLAAVIALCAGLGWLLADVWRRAPMSGEWVWRQSISVSTAQLLAYIIGLASLAFGVLVVKRPTLLRARW